MTASDTSVAGRKPSAVGGKSFGDPRQVPFDRATPSRRASPGRGSRAEALQHSLVRGGEDGRGVAPEAHGREPEILEEARPRLEHDSAVTRRAVAQQAAGPPQVGEIDAIRGQDSAEVRGERQRVEVRHRLYPKSQSESARKSPRAREPKRTSRSRPGRAAAARRRAHEGGVLVVGLQHGT